MEGRHNGCGKEGEPDKSTEDDGSDTSIARSPAPPQVEITPESGDGYPGGEPEDHGIGLDGADGILVGGSGETSWCEYEVGHGKKCPNGAEEHKVYAVRRPIPGTNDVCRKTQHDQRKDSLNGTKGENKGKCHVDGSRGMEIVY